MQRSPMAKKKLTAKKVLSDKIKKTLKTVRNRNSNRAKPDALKARNSISLQKLPFNLSSVDDDLIKLETLSSKNLIARFDWLRIEERLIQLGAKKKLEPIVKSFNLRRSSSIEVNGSEEGFELFKLKNRLDYD